MRKATPLTHLPSILSLDIATGAVISALFFSSIFHVTIRPYGLAALWLTVWIIYTADHLRDSRTIQGEASTHRHRFHQRHFHLLMMLVVIACVIDVVLLFFIRRSVLLWGLGLSMLVLMYLGYQRFFPYLKETVVAILYSLGVLLPSLAPAASITWIQLMLMMLFFSVSWLNLIIFSIYDQRVDEHDKLGSFVTAFGRRRARRLCSILFLQGLGLSIYIMADGIYRVPAIILLSMLFVLFVVFAFERFFSVNDRYRLAGDSVFLLPLLIWV